MRRNRKDKFIKHPHYVGGIKAQQVFIKKNMHYPKNAVDNKIEGTVHLRYSIDKRGNTFNIKVVSGIGYGCDKEAKRLVGLLKYEIPKNRVGRIVFHKTLQIHFKLSDIDLTPTLNYSYLPNTNNETNSYHYQIDL